MVTADIYQVILQTSRTEGVNNYTGLKAQIGIQILLSGLQIDYLYQYQTKMAKQFRHNILIKNRRYIDLK
ncbi:hypothetical protein DBV15_08556 [Temnothorax longispinosus]|uniref:Uncharacterized protein n=1 Tax=Temnothorax longispinosus TaxID=300112 RepID=A0A4S2L4A7_9HYME|nr:hypothetical protein DBV15_08556 [Temnothorax longispinosus]